MTAIIDIQVCHPKYVMSKFTFLISKCIEYQLNTSFKLYNPLIVFMQKIREEKSNDVNNGNLGMTYGFTKTLSRLRNVYI